MRAVFWYGKMRYNHRLYKSIWKFYGYKVIWLNNTRIYIKSLNNANIQARVQDFMVEEVYISYICSLCTVEINIPLPKFILVKIKEHNRQHYFFLFDMNTNSNVYSLRSSAKGNLLETNFSLLQNYFMEFFTS